MLSLQISSELSSKLRLHNLPITIQQPKQIRNPPPFFFPFFFLHFSHCMRKEFWGLRRRRRWRRWRRQWGVPFGAGEWGVHGQFVCAPHPLVAQSGLYCILQIYTQDVGLECFPEKKRGLFFTQVSVCFHEQEWLRLTNKPLFPCSQMQGLSSDLQPQKTHICTVLHTLEQRLYGIKPCRLP